MVVVAVIVGVATVLSAVAGYDSTGTWSASSHYSSSTYNGAVTPTAGEQRATLVATQAFRRQVVEATEQFATSTAALVASIRASRVDAAKSDELAAQAAFDNFRPAVSDGVGSLAPLDALVQNQDPALPPEGLHAVERDLWTDHVSRALTPATTLANDALTIEVALFRSIVTPTTICSDLQESLSWTVDDVIDTSQEQFSHDDMLDVHTTVTAAAADLTSVEALGDLVAPTVTAQLQQRFTRLSETVLPLVRTTPDASVSAHTWRTIAEEIDAVLAPLGELGGRLYGYGTGRAYA